MAFDQFQVQRARAAIEDVDADEGNFAADLTGDVGANFFDFRHEPFRLMRQTLTAPDTTVVQRAYQRRNHVLGPDRASAQIAAFWTGTNEVLDAAATPTKRAQSKILEALLGGYNAAAGSLVEASPSPTTTSASVTATQGSRFTVGTIVAIGASAATALPVLLTNVSTDALTWWPALPAAPSTGDKVYNSQSIYFNEDSKQAVQLLCEFARQRGNLFLGLGGGGDFTLDVTRGQLAKWGSTLQFAQYLHDDELATPQGGGAISTASYDDTGPIFVAEGGCHFAATSSSTRTLIRAASIAVTFGGAAGRFEVGLHSGVEGLAAWERNTRDEITIELTLLKPDPYEDYQDAFAAETDYGLLFWMGDGAGKGRSFAAPTCQIAAPPEPVEAFGLEGQKLTLLVKENSKSVTQATAVRRSPIVLGHY